MSEFDYNQMVIIVERYEKNREKMRERYKPKNGIRREAEPNVSIQIIDKTPDPDDQDKQIVHLTVSLRDYYRIKKMIKYTEKLRENARSKYKTMTGTNRPNIPPITFEAKIS